VKQLFDLRALRGKIVVVNVWATWCTPCRAEMPALSAFYESHQNTGLTLVGLSADRARDEDDVRKAMRAIKYPAVLLKKAKVNELGSPASLPITFVVDRTGVVRFVVQPQKDAQSTIDALEKAVAPLLRAEPSPQQ
jgi:thiol-disulfide isomerase/thioredoxin